MKDLGEETFRELIRARIRIAGLVAAAYFLSKCAGILADSWGLSGEDN